MIMNSKEYFQIPFAWVSQNNGPFAARGVFQEHKSFPRPEERGVSSWCLVSVPEVVCAETNEQRLV